MFRCECCNIEFDSDYQEIHEFDDMEVCKDCYEKAIYESHLESERKNDKTKI